MSRRCSPPRRLRQLCRGKPAGIAYARCPLRIQVRCSTYLYTLCVADSDKADKLKQSLPPGLQVLDNV